MNREGALPASHRVCLAASKVFHRVCLSHGRILAHWREPVNRAINLRFRSLAVDHFANLASYSTVQWRKTMGKTMTGAKSFTSAVVLCSEPVSVFVPLLLFLYLVVSNGRWTTFIVAYCSDCSLIPFQFSPIRFYNTFVSSSNCSMIERERERGSNALFFPILSFTWTDDSR